MRVLKLSKNEKILLIVAATLQLFIFIVWHFKDPSRFVEEDGKSYVTVAQSIINEHRFSTYGLDIPDAGRTPLLPLILAALYLISPHLSFLVIAQNIISLLSVLVVYRVVLLLFGQILEGDDRFSRAERLALVVGILFAIESERLKISNVLEAEPLFILLFYGSVWWLARWIFIEKKNWQMAVVGVLLGLATLTKPMGQAMAALFIASIAFDYRLRYGFKRIEIKKYALAALIFAVTFGATILPWSVRNKYQFGSWKISPLFAYAIWQSRVMEWKQYLMTKSGMGHEEKTRYQRDEENRMAKIILKDHPELDKIFKDKPQRLLSGGFISQQYLADDIKRQVFLAPWSFTKFVGYQISIFFMDSAWSSVMGKVLNPLVVLPMRFYYPYIFWTGRFIWLGYYAVILFGLIVGRYKIKKHLWIFSLVVLPIIYVGTLSSFSHTTRYRLPINPLILFLFVYFGSVLWRAFKQKVNLHVNRLSKTFTQSD